MDITVIITCSWAEEEMTAGTYWVFRVFMTGRNVSWQVCSASPTSRQPKRRAKLPCRALATGTV